MDDSFIRKLVLVVREIERNGFPRTKRNSMRSREDRNGVNQQPCAEGTAKGKRALLTKLRRLDLQREDTDLTLACGREPDVGGELPIYPQLRNGGSFPGVEVKDLNQSRFAEGLNSKRQRFLSLQHYTPVVAAGFAGGFTGLYCVFTTPITGGGRSLIASWSEVSSANDQEDRIASGDCGSVFGCVRSQFPARPDILNSGS
jgi:hypothetical protein